MGSGLAVKVRRGMVRQGGFWYGKVRRGMARSGLAVEARTGGVSSGLDRFDRLRYGSYV